MVIRMDDAPTPSDVYPLCPHITLGTACTHYCLWGSKSCLAHLPETERTQRIGRRPSYAAWLAADPQEPACWSWEVPLLIPRFDDEGGADRLLGDWHEWQCAVCGCLYPEVTDHDHQTGLVRGRLCRSCNVLEGRAPEDGLFGRYRTRNPASILGLKVRYWNPFTGYAEPVAVPTPDEQAAEQRRVRSIVDRLSLPEPKSLLRKSASERAKES
jgi:hypothetical protein